MMDELTGFQRDLLFVLHGLEAANGQEVLAEMESSQHRDIKHGRLYDNLDALAECGLVDKSKRDGRTNHYRLTERGKTVVTERHQWEKQYLVP